MRDTFGPTAHPAVWLEGPAAPRPKSRRDGSLAALFDLISAWEERARFRWDLDQMAKANPHLIGDIGLTRQQAEAEIAKPFWRE